MYVINLTSVALTQSVCKVVLGNIKNHVTFEKMFLLMKLFKNCKAIILIAKLKMLQPLSSLWVQSYINSLNLKIVHVFLELILTS